MLAASPHVYAQAVLEEFRRLLKHGTAKRGCHMTALFRQALESLPDPVSLPESSAPQAPAVVPNGLFAIFAPVEQLESAILEQAPLSLPGCSSEVRLRDCECSRAERSQAQSVAEQQHADAPPSEPTSSASQVSTFSLSEVEGAEDFAAAPARRRGTRPGAVEELQAKYPWGKTEPGLQSLSP